MNARAREIELLLLTAFAAAPLYFTAAVGPVPLLVFHAVMLLMALRVWRGHTPEVIPESVMRGIAVAYIPLYIADAAVNHAIAASAHLVLFIALYQPVESLRRNNHAQRLLTASLIFIASLATSTDISIVLFVAVFAFLLFRQLMLLSHMETAASIGHEYEDAPSNRAAAFYLAGSTALAILLFPVVPRTRNPLVQGFTGSLTNAATGLSNTIDFSQDRSSTADPAVVARVWMSQEAIPFFTPLRLRGNVYDRYLGNIWLQSQRGFRDIGVRDGAFRIARPIGFTRLAHVQERFARGAKLFLPTGTYAVSGLFSVAEGPASSTYVTSTGTRELQTFDVAMARRVLPIRPEVPRLVTYPVTANDIALARQIAGNQPDAMSQAQNIERYMSTHFRYYMRPELIGRPLTVEEFLHKERRGHCEYFAAGMVVLMTALGHPARIVGGFYGGRLNPLTGYFVIRREDAHAWVEVWDGQAWETFDPTPASLRPGNAQEGFLRTYLSALNDSVNFFWDRYVLTFGLADQVALAMEMITRMRGGLHRSRATLTAARHKYTYVDALNLIGVLIAIAGLVMIIRRRRRPIFDDLAAHLRLRGVNIGPAMTMDEALEHLRRTQPEAARELAPLIAMYEEEIFSAHRDRSRVAAIRRGLTHISEGRTPSSAGRV